MAYIKENELVETTNFMLPVTAEGEFSNEDLSEDFEGLQLKFQRAKIPAGGALQFELPGDDLENPEYSKVIEGVIIYNHAACVYWPEGAKYDDNVSPLCSSVDGKTGYGTPGGACELCELNRYGTGVDSKGNPSKGKACKNMRQLYILRSGEYMPVLLSLPPTSLRPFNDFMNTAFVSRRRPTWSSVVQIGLRRIENGSSPYSVASLKKLYDFSGEQLAQIKAYADSFRGQIKDLRQQQAAAVEEQAGTDAVYNEDSGYTVTQTDGHFCISSQDMLDGEREDLPA